MSIYKAYYEDDEKNICWIFDEETYRHGLDLYKETTYNMFMKRID